MSLASLVRAAAALAAALALLACGSAPPVAPDLGVEAGDAAEPASGEPAGDPPSADDGGEGPTNTVKWTTATELDNFGFDVYRAESPEGPWERINTEVIEGAGTTDEPHSYRFVDDRIEPGRTYYYYVESISMSGVRKRFTPIGEAPPKPPPDS